MSVDDRTAIRTVLGDVSASELGVTNMHAHLVMNLYESSAGDPLYEDFVLTSDEMLRELDGVPTRRGRALVECTPRGLGRNPAWLRDAALRTGLMIVAGAGLYHERFHPAEIEESDDDALAQQFVDEVEIGLDGTDVRAGIIGEIGTNGDVITHAEERVFRAAARAALRTGVAVSTHTHLGGSAEAQLDILTSEGLAAHRVVIGHLDDVPSIDLNLCRRLIERGAYVQFDGVGCEYYSETIGSQMPTDDERLRAIAVLADAGFASRILLASDVCRKRHLVVNGGPGLCHFFGDFLALAESVLGSELAHTVLVENPRDVLALREMKNVDSIPA